MPTKQVSIMLLVDVDDTMTFENIDGLVRDMLDCPDDGFFRINSINVKDFPPGFESEKGWGISKVYGDSAPEWLMGDAGRWSGTEEEAKAKAEYLTSLFSKRKVSPVFKLTYTAKKLV